MGLKRFDFYVFYIIIFFYICYFYSSFFIFQIIFVVDTSNLCQISAAAVLLYTLLAEPRLKNAKVFTNLRLYSSFAIFRIDIDILVDAKAQAKMLKVKKCVGVLSSTNYIAYEYDQ